MPGWSSPPSLHAFYPSLIPCCVHRTGANARWVQLSVGDQPVVPAGSLPRAVVGEVVDSGDGQRAVLCPIPASPSCAGPTKDDWSFSVVRLSFYR